MFCQISDPRLHGAAQADVIGNTSGVRKQLTEVHPAFSVSGELPGTGKQLAALLNHVVEMNIPFQGLEMIFDQLRLRVAEIHVTRPALHEHRDHRSRLRLLDRRARHEVERAALQRRFGWRCEKAILLHQGSHRQAPKSKGLLGKKVTASQMRHRLRPLFDIQKSIGTYQRLAQVREGSLLWIGELW